MVHENGEQKDKEESVGRRAVILLQAREIEGKKLKWRVRAVALKKKTALFC